MRDIESVIQNIQKASSPDEAFNHYNQAMKSYGYNNNCYTLMNDHASIGQEAYHGLATSYPQDWLDYYKEKEYQKVDCVWNRLLESPTPFFWSDLIEKYKQEKSVDESTVALSERVLNEAEDAGVADGIGISFVNPMGEIAGIGLSREKAEDAKNYNDMADVYLISAVFHEKYMSLFKRPELPTFSEREKDVLLWSSEGKTDWEIGQILDISVPTVRFHWKNIFSKTGVNSKIFATMLAIRNKIITPQLIRPTYQK